MRREPSEGDFIPDELPEYAKSYILPRVMRKETVENRRRMGRRVRSRDRHKNSLQEEDRFKVAMIKASLDYASDRMPNFPSKLKSSPPPLPPIGEEGGVPRNPSPTPDEKMDKLLLRLGTFRSGKYSKLQQSSNVNRLHKISSRQAQREARNASLVPCTGPGSLMKYIKYVKADNYVPVPVLDPETGVEHSIFARNREIASRILEEEDEEEEEYEDEEIEEEEHLTYYKDRQKAADDDDPDDEFASRNITPAPGVPPPDKPSTRSKRKKKKRKAKKGPSVTVGGAHVSISSMYDSIALQVKEAEEEANEITSKLRLSQTRLSKMFEDDPGDRDLDIESDSDRNKYAQDGLSVSSKLVLEEQAKKDKGMTRKASEIKKKLEEAKRKELAEKRRKVEEIKKMKMGNNDDDDFGVRPSQPLPSFSDSSKRTSRLSSRSRLSSGMRSRLDSVASTEDGVDTPGPNPAEQANLLGLLVENPRKNYWYKDSSSSSGSETESDPDDGLVRAPNMDPEDTLELFIDPNNVYGKGGELHPILQDVQKRLETMTSKIKYDREEQRKKEREKRAAIREKERRERELRGILQKWRRKAREKRKRTRQGLRGQSGSGVGSLSGQVADIEAFVKHIRARNRGLVCCNHAPSMSPSQAGPFLHSVPLVSLSAEERRQRDALRGIKTTKAKKTFF